MEKSKKVIPYLVGILIVILILVVGSLDRTLTDREAEIGMLNREIIIERSLKDNTHTALTKIIQTERSENFLKLQSKDSTIIRLQSLVKEYKGLIDRGGSATVLDSEVAFDIKSKTDSVYFTDTIYPTYKTYFNSDGWVFGTIVASKDSFQTDIKVREKFDIVIGKHRKNIFSPTENIVKIKSYNPYSTTKDITTYNIRDKPKPFGVGINAGYSLVLDTKPRFSPTFGVGLQYNFIRF